MVYKLIQSIFNMEEKINTEFLLKVCAYMAKTGISGISYDELCEIMKETEVSNA